MIARVDLAGIAIALGWAALVAYVIAWAARRGWSSR